MSTRIVPVPGTNESCPYGRKVHRAAYVVRTGAVRGATCETHLAQCQREHVRAVRIAARMR